MSALPLQFITSYFVDQSKLLQAKLFSLWCAIGTQCYLRNLKPCFVIRMFQRRLTKLKASSWSYRAGHKPSPTFSMWYKYDRATDELNLCNLHSLYVQHCYVCCLYLGQRNMRLKQQQLWNPILILQQIMKWNSIILSDISSSSNKKIHILHFLQTLLMGMKWKWFLE